MIRPNTYILAGGQSIRFGSDKARAKLNGKALILHARDALEPFAASLTVVSDKSGKYADLGLRTIADEKPHLGPLGGIAAALADCPDNDAHVLICACDLVFQNDEALRLLLGAARPTDDAIALCMDNRCQPFPALYRSRLLPEIRQRLAGDDRSVRALLNDYARPIEFTAGIGTTIDCNTPSHLQSLADARFAQHNAP